MTQHGIHTVHFIINSQLVSKSSTSFLIRGTVVANPREYPTIPLAPAVLHTLLLRTSIQQLSTGARRRSPAGYPTPMVPCFSGKGGAFPGTKIHLRGCPFQSYRGDVVQTIHVLPTPGAANIHSLLVACEEPTGNRTRDQPPSDQVL